MLKNNNRVIQMRYIFAIFILLPAISCYSPRNNPVDFTGTGWFISQICLFFSLSAVYLLTFYVNKIIK